MDNDVAVLKACLLSVQLAGNMLPLGDMCNETFSKILQGEIELKRPDSFENSCLLMET
jgi:hypothetical protein